MIVGAQIENLRAVASPNSAQLRRAREIPYLASFEYLNNVPSVKKILILDRSVRHFIRGSRTSSLSANGANSRYFRFQTVSKHFPAPGNCMLRMRWT